MIYKTRINLKANIVFCLFFITTQFSFSQESSGTIDLTVDTFKEFEVFGDTLDNYSVYFTGENHTYATYNTELQLKLLKYLHQEQNVKHFIFEQSPGLSYIINKIVLEDKTTHLHYLRDMFFDPFYDMVKDLRKYNDTLLPANKIQVHGIDIERFPSFSIYALNEMIDTLDKSVKGGEVFEQIQALATSDFKNAGPAAFYSDPEVTGFGFGQVSAWESLESILTGAIENRDSLVTVLGADSTNFYSIIESLEIGHEWYVTEQNGDVKSPIIRERFMADEFERVYAADMVSKYYGQFGRCHLHKDQDAGRCYDYYMNSIANRINDVHPSLKNQVLVIPIFYGGLRDFDRDVINSLDLDTRFTDTKESFIIDLAYKEGDHSIVGFYNNLPFVIICNGSKDEVDYYSYDWDDNLAEYHLGPWLGYTYFNKLSKLNNVLINNGFSPFDSKMLTYSISADFFVPGEVGVSYTYDYFPEISNGDRFNLRGYKIGMGTTYPVGGKWILAAVGLDVEYGQMKLIETQETTAPPNIIQIDNLNQIIYKNDVFTLDPNLQLRLTLPVISLNAKIGYALDISGKYWRLDGKAKDFTKTSFSAPYVQVGASINLKTN
ncbi:MAG: hypothetical protein GQ574_17175 [Crocinitomix sp.]|nr:hypothetical protein [Crocinitomix sp.]